MKVADYLHSSETATTPYPLLLTDEISQRIFDIYTGKEEDCKYLDRNSWENLRIYHHHSL